MGIARRVTGILGGALVFVACGGTSSRNSESNAGGSPSAGSGGSTATPVAGSGPGGAGAGGSSSGAGGLGGAAGGAGRITERGTVDHGFVLPDACAFYTSSQCVGEGLHCESLTTDGAVQACLGHYRSPPGSCSPAGRPEDECCYSDECREGVCVGGEPNPRRTTCGEPDSVPQYNRCMGDDCSSDDECPSGGICTGPDIFSVRRCIPASCKRDADCSERPGGACRFFAGGCCNIGEPGSGGCEVCQATLPGPFRELAVVCTYPDDGCRYDGDCPEGSQCTVVGGVAACRPECTENQLSVLL